MPTDRFYNFIKKATSLSYSEARGFTKLLLVLLLALMLFLIPKLFPEFNIQSDKEEGRQMDSLVSVLKNKDRESQALFLFDPNEISLDSLLLLGFQKKTAENLIRYKSKGGKFYEKEDLNKIYGVSDSMMAAVYSFIDLPDSTDAKAVLSLQKFDLNLMTVEQLKNIPLIGEVLSGRIVRYRNMLGGFVLEDQLTEVYGLSEEAKNSLLSKSFILSTFRPQKIKINRVDMEVMQSHPYINFQLANDILLYRGINGSISSEKVLADFKSIDKGNFEKLILYLDFQ